MKSFCYLFLCSTLLIFSGCVETKKGESSADQLNESSDVESETQVVKFDSLWTNELEDHQSIGAIEKIEIPLNNDDGVPYFEDDLGIYVEGFDVNSKGDLFFMGGIESNQLVRFSNDRFLYRKNYDSIDLSSFHHINDSTIVLLNTKFGKNELFWINSESGKVRASFGRIIENDINSCSYNDSTLIIEPFNIEESITTSTQLGFVKFDLEGNLIRPVKNEYDLPTWLVRIRQDSSVFENEVLGVWKDYFVKLIVNEKSQYKILLVSSSKEIIKSHSIPRNDLGMSLWGDSNEHQKLVGNKVYLLMQEGSNAVVNIIDLNIIFP